MVALVWKIISLRWSTLQNEDVYVALSFSLCARLLVLQHLHSWATLRSVYYVNESLAGSAACRKVPMDAERFGIVAVSMFIVAPPTKDLEERERKL